MMEKSSLDLGLRGLKSVAVKRLVQAIRTKRWVADFSAARVPWKTIRIPRDSSLFLDFKFSSRRD